MLETPGPPRKGGHTPPGAYGASSAPLGACIREFDIANLSTVRENTRLHARRILVKSSLTLETAGFKRDETDRSHVRFAARSVAACSLY